MLADVTFDEVTRPDVLARLNGQSAESLTFGAIQLSPTGVILAYNTAESQLACRTPAMVIGRNFFEEVAPCTRTPAFRDAFLAGVRAGALDRRFRYVFDYRMQPTPVEVHLKRAVADDSYWIFVKRLPKDS
ncbi:MAG: photoactive yellow protein [Gemmatimonadales bacterium]|nr:photoactive yellow protein [Gemmatimonadales bacterium]